MSKKALVTISFGTTHKDALEKSIKIVEQELINQHKERDFFRAFTSRIILKKLKNKGQDIKNETDILQHLFELKYDDILIQPLHIIPGHEYEKILSAISIYKSKFNKIQIIQPLIYNDIDYSEIILAMEKELNELINNYDTVLYMGHGTSHYSNACYSRLQLQFEVQKKKMLIANVEGYPDLEWGIEKLRAKKANKILLMPFMMVAGEHTKNDMMGDDSDSWVNILKRKGFKVDVIPKGLGEYKTIRELIIKNSTRKQLNHIQEY